VLRVSEDGAKEQEFTQSNAIMRFVGRKVGLYPSNELEALAVDQFLDAAEDIGKAIGPSNSEKDEAVKAAMRETLASTTIPRYLKGIERLLEANKGDGPFAVGDKLSIADLKLFGLVRYLNSGTLDGIPTTIVDPYPRAVGLAKAVGDLDFVKEHLQKHA
jgi:glutathione S-transferase